MKGIFNKNDALKKLSWAANIIETNTQHWQRNIDNMHSEMVIK